MSRRLSPYTFAVIVASLLVSANLARETVLAQDSGGTGLVRLDANHDGVQDVAMFARDEHDAIEVLIYDGKSRFGAPTLLCQIVGFGFEAADPVVMNAVDADHDGDLDLVVTNRPDLRHGGSTISPSGSQSEGGAFAGPTPTTWVLVVPPNLPRFIDLDDSQGSGPRAAIRSRQILGDKDNFGFPESDPAPCIFFDNRGPEDIGVFDYEASDGSDAVENWTHEVDVLGSSAKRVRFSIGSIFSDDNSSTISIGGIVLDFVGGGPIGPCNGYPVYGHKRNFFFSGSDAQMADDGVVEIQFAENGDDIALEGSGLVVTWNE